jgi:hypothetical protein
MARDTIGNDNTNSWFVLNYIRAYPNKPFALSPSTGLP